MKDRFTINCGIIGKDVEVEFDEMQHPVEIVCKEYWRGLCRVLGTECQWLHMVAKAILKKS